MAEPFRPRSSVPTKDESLHSFISRRLGSSIASNIFSAVVHGIYAGDTKKLSVHSTFKVLPEMEKRSGSIVLDIFASMFRKSPPPVKQQSDERGTVRADKQFVDFVQKLQATSSIYSFKNGMQTLSDTLENKLVKNGVEIIPDSCASVDFTHSLTKATVSLESSDRILEADHVFSGVPASILKNLLHQPAFHPLKDELAKIESVDVAVVNLVYQDVVLPVQGFGFLVPSQQDVKALGCVFDSCSFPAHAHNSDNLCVLTVMMGGHMFEKQFGDPDKVSVEDLLEHATKNVVDKVLNIPSSALVEYKVHIQKQCIPQYTLGHNERVSRIKAMKPQCLSLIGASYDGVAINDCILNAKQSVDAMHNT